MSISASKNAIIRDLFVRTADENYITARWCAVNGFNSDFLWLSLHALEKYIKAVLLINGKTAKGYSHDIVKLYCAVKPIGELLLPTTISRPENLDIEYWSDSCVDYFIAKLQRNGNEQNRYLIHGYSRDSEDIHMLDAMVFAIRRLICPLDDVVSSGKDSPDFTHRELLKRQPEYFGNMGMPLDKLIETRESSDYKTAALNLNMAFAPDDFPHTSIRSGCSFRNPVIDYLILQKLESNSTERAKEGVEIAQWFLKNVQTHIEVGKVLKVAISDATKKHDFSDHPLIPPSPSATG